MTKYLAFAMVSILLAACNSKPKPASDDEMETESSYYTEDHRPQFHFSPEQMWMNDPNGMVYYDGEFHLFYQYYPDSNVWGPMHWGHAISRDLVHWEHLAIALYPDSLGYIFSGSAVIDHANTSGFGTADNPPMIAIFTHHEPVGAADENAMDFQYQSIAYSTDRGRTWTKYEGNPVVANPGIRDFRDPKVIWDVGSEQWVMVFAAYDHLKIYGSSDLKNWEHLSDFGKTWGTHGGVWECPDLFPMKVDGSDTERWILLQSINPGGPHGGSATQYFVGDFDGKEFQLDKTFSDDVRNENAVWLEYGKDNYAGVTWSDVPETDGRRIFLGWMSNWQYAQIVPTYVWRSAMTIPRELVLKETEVGLRVASIPVAELSSLRSESFDLQPGEVQGTIDILAGLSQKEGLYEIEIEFENNSAEDIVLVLSNNSGDEVKFGYETEGNYFFVDRSNSGKVDFSPDFPGTHTAPRILSSDRLSLHCFIDVSSIEVFGDDGLSILTEIFFPNEVLTDLSLQSTGEGLKIASGQVHALKQIWR